MKKPLSWLDEQLKDTNFRRLLAQEEFIEGFLNPIDEYMNSNNVSNAELSMRMGCEPADIMQIMERTRNLTVEMMVDIAFYLDLKLELSVRDKAALTLEPNGDDQSKEQTMKVFKFDDDVVVAKDQLDAPVVWDAEYGDGVMPIGNPEDWEEVSSDKAIDIHENDDPESPVVTKTAAEWAVEKGRGCLCVSQC